MKYCAWFKDSKIMSYAMVGYVSVPNILIFTDKLEINT